MDHRVVLPRTSPTIASVGAALADVPGLKLVLSENLVGLGQNSAPQGGGCASCLLDDHLPYAASC